MSSDRTLEAMISLAKIETRSFRNLGRPGQCRGLFTAAMLGTMIELDILAIRLLKGEELFGVPDVASTLLADGLREVRAG